MNEFQTDDSSASESRNNIHNCPGVVIGGLHHLIAFISCPVKCEISLVSVISFSLKIFTLF